MKKKLCIFIALVLLAGLLSFPPPAPDRESSQPVIVVPTFDPRPIGTDCVSFIIPALTKLTVITLVALED